MSAPVVIGIGEVLYDIVGNAEELGGAPANFAYHAGRLGAEAYIVSTIGDDKRGDTALKELARRKLNIDCITRTDKTETGYVKADVDADGIATYLFPDDIAWDNIELNERALEVAQKADGVCFGTLAQRSETSRRAIYRLLELVQDDCIKVCDINLRQNFYSPAVITRSLDYADMLKLNDDELPLVAKLLNLSGSARHMLNSLIDQYRLKLAVLTRGGDGSLLVSPDGYSDHPGVPIDDLQDTIGAGDAFTASTLVNLLAGEDLDTINDKANRLAAQVCSHKGAMPLL